MYRIRKYLNACLVSKTIKYFNLLWRIKRKLAGYDLKEDNRGYFLTKSSVKIATSTVQKNVLIVPIYRREASIIS